MHPGTDYMHFWNNRNRAMQVLARRSDIQRVRDARRRLVEAVLVEAKRTHPDLADMSPRRAAEVVVATIR